jgi:hypothetical protein
MFHNFIQDDLMMNYYCRNMKSLIDSLCDLGCKVGDHNLVLNVLHRLNKWYKHLRAINMRNKSFLTFLKVRDGLVLEELTLGPDTSWLTHMRSTPTTPEIPPLFLIHIPLAMAAMVRDWTVVMDVIMIGGGGRGTGSSSLG